MLFLVAPVLTVNSTSSTSISLSWTQDGSSVDTYTSSYVYSIRECSTGYQLESSVRIYAGDVRGFVLTGLDEYSNYTITLITVRGGEQIDSSISATTNQTG